MKSPKAFYNRLRRLIEDEMPDNCHLAYDMGVCQLYVIKKGATFISHRKSDPSTSWHGVTPPDNAPRLDEGYESDSVIGDGIDIDMAAVQQ